MTKNAVGVAVLGIGYWGPNILRTLLKISGCRVLWACDKKPGRLKYIADNFPDVPLTSDYKTVLQDRDVEAVFLATPPSTHYDLGRAGLEAGKHVYIEKPLTLEGAAAHQLLELAEDNERILFSGYVFAYHPAVTTMKQMIHDGQLGQLCYAESSRVNLGSPSADVDVLWDLAAHDISILIHLLEAKPLEVSACAERCVHPTFRDVAFVRVRFQDGFFSEHHVSWLSPQRVRRFSVYGSKGSMTFDDTRDIDKLHVFGRGVDTRARATDTDAKELFYAAGKVLVPDLASEQPLGLECEHFLDCIRNGVSPVTDGRLGLTVTEVLEAAKSSAELQSRPVRLSAVAQPFHARQ